MTDSDPPVDHVTDSARQVLPMFPLGSVLLPSMVLPLHVFEPRYRTLMHDVGVGGRFGVVMIERGSEVGGGDVRGQVACVARVIAAEEQDDGRWHVVCVGDERVAVQRWLPDDPYPMAQVSVLDEPAPIDTEDGSWPALELAFRGLLDRLMGLGGSVPPTIELSSDCSVATYQMAAVGPFEVLDQYRVLGAVDPESRRDLLFEAIDGVRMVLDADR
jgi:Lon protease-like protein